MDVGKLQIREFLEKVYNLPVLRVDTAIVYGKKKRVEPKNSMQKQILSKHPDFKKVWVQFAPGRLYPSVMPENSS